MLLFLHQINLSLSQGRVSLQLLLLRLLHPAGYISPQFQYLLTATVFLPFFEMIFNPFTVPKSPVIFTLLEVTAVTLPEPLALVAFTTVWSPDAAPFNLASLH